MGFAVTRTSKSLVAPSSPTPAGETLRLSSLDRVPGLRHLVLSLHAFDGATRVDAAVVGEGGEAAASPARVVREALGKALVDYYPFAGRFLEPEGESGEVRVACTGEGAWFVEAMAACSLEDVKHLDHPMVIPKEELLPEPSPDVPALDMPLMMQGWACRRWELHHGKLDVVERGDRFTGVAVYPRSRSGEHSTYYHALKMHTVCS